MELQSLKKLTSRNGQPASLKIAFKKDFLADMLNLTANDIVKKIIKPVLKTSPDAVTRENLIYVYVLAMKSAGNTIANRIKSISWVEFKRINVPNKINVVLKFNPKEVSKQLSKLNDVQKNVALELMNDFEIRIEIAIQNSKSSASSAIVEKKKNVVKKFNKSILNEYSFTLNDIGIKTGIKYSMKTLDSAIDKGIQKYPDAFPIVMTILNQARNCSSVKKTVKSGLILRDLYIIETNFLLLAAAVSALHVNSKLKIMFSANGFVLFIKDHPIGRFGKKLKKTSMKKLFEMCRNECGNIPGKTQAIMDAIDAEGKKKEDKMKELFNDFAKHVIINSGGPAAKAANKLKKTAQIVEKMNWSNFKKSFDLASKHVREIDFDPMVKDMEKTVKELNQGRNVLNLSDMKWMDIFRKKKLSWLGTLTADILEDEVNSKPQAIEALSCVVNWFKNQVKCKLTIKHVGSEGESIAFTPCQKLNMQQYKIELQDILKSGPKWSLKR